MCQNDGALFYASHKQLSVISQQLSTELVIEYHCFTPFLHLLIFISVKWLIFTFTYYTKVQLIIDNCSLIIVLCSIGWLGIQCRVELLYRCRSNTGQCNELPVSQLSYASGCRDCTLMFVSVNSYPSTVIITEDGWKPHVSTTNRIKIITQNINNKKVSDLKNNNNEKENFIIDRDILCRCY